MLGAAASRLFIEARGAISTKAKLHGVAVGRRIFLLHRCRFVHALSWLVSASRSCLLGVSGEPVEMDKKPKRRKSTNPFDSSDEESASEDVFHDCNDVLGKKREAKLDFNFRSDGVAGKKVLYIGVSVCSTNLSLLLTVSVVSFHREYRGTRPKV